MEAAKPSGGSSTESCHAEPTTGHTRPRTVGKHTAPSPSNTPPPLLPPPPPPLLLLLLLLPLLLLLLLPLLEEDEEEDEEDDSRFSVWCARPYMRRLGDMLSASLLPTANMRFGAQLNRRVATSPPPPPPPPPPPSTT